MKPKTKLHKLVASLFIKLKGLTINETLYIKDKIFQHYAYTTNKQITCLDCNHVWENKYKKNTLLFKLHTNICPNCGKKLKPLEGRHRKQRNVAYALKIDKYKNDFQLVRIFIVERDLCAGKKANWFIKEVCQHWIRATDGKNTIYAQSSNGFGGFYSHGPAWNYKGFEVRVDYSKFYINDGFYLPNKKVINLIKKYGFKGNFHDIYPANLFRTLLSKDTKAEQLLKMNQISLFQNVFRSNNEFVIKYWKQILIANRHKYIIKDGSDWLDHLRLLEFYKLDIHNPKFICPENFHEEHQRLVQKRGAEIERERERLKNEHLKEEAERLRKQRKEYPKRIKKFKDIVISDGMFDIKVIPTIKEVAFQI